jgi:hypothetical protein
MRRRNFVTIIGGATATALLTMQMTADKVIE